jgi:hypothetical protein
MKTYLGATLLAALLSAAASASAQIYAAVLPTVRSEGSTSHPVTAFATIMNAGSTTAKGCFITSSSMGLFYQTTDPATNMPNGTPNTPVDIPAGGSQSFVVAVTPTTIIPVSGDAGLAFTCANTAPAPIVAALNTLQLSTLSSVDVIMISATHSHDGVLRLTGNPPTGVFAVAGVNVGTVAAVAGSIELSAPAGLQVTSCVTDPNTGQCFGSDLSPSPGQTFTLTVFVAALKPIPFDPSNNRIVVDFTTLIILGFGHQSVTVGETSVAVTTE